MDCTPIFNNQFFTHTMINVMAPIELYHFRCLTPYIYKHITMNDIKNKIIKNVKWRLKYWLGDHYNNFINC